jgi:hypothetical protein
MTAWKMILRQSTSGADNTFMKDCDKRVSFDDRCEMKTSRSLSRTEEGLREKSLGSGNEVAPGGVGSIPKKRGNERPNWRGRGLAKPQSMMLYHVNQHLIVGM